MSSNPFDTNPELQKILDNLTEAQSPESLSAAFQKVSALQPDARAYIVDKFESQIDETLQEVLNSPPALVDTIKANIAYLEKLSAAGADAGVFGSQLNDFVCVSKAVAFILENKGDGALESTKAYAAEAAKLSDAEYAVPRNHAKIWAGLAGKNAKTPAPNPFRKSK